VVVRLVAVAIVLAGLSGAVAQVTASVAPTPGVEGLPAAPGPALRRAVAAIEAGDLARAEAWIAEIAARHPIIADYADLLQMRLLVESGRFEEAVARVEPRVRPESSARIERFELLGRAHEALGREVQARDAWEQATRLTRSRARLADLHTRIAESFVRSGKPKRAAERYRRIWVKYAELPEADAAEQALSDLERELRVTWRDAKHTLERAGTLYARRRNEAALAAYDQALAKGLPSRSRRRASAGRADTLFRLRRYPEAAIAYGELPKSEEWSIQRARAHARSGQVKRGARDLEELGRGSRSSRGTRALLLAALLWDGEDEWERARALYTKVVSRGGSAGGSARWRLGWRAYTHGRFEEALHHFHRLRRGEKDPIVALRPRYWALRAREQSGEREAALGYAELANEFPLTYYGWRAARRAPPGFDAAPRVLDAIAGGSVALRPTDLARVRILIEAGLSDAARSEIGRLDRAARGLQDRLGLAQLHAELGDFNRAQRLIVDGYGQGLSRGPVPGQLELWWHAWPAPFEAEVREVEASGVELDTALLYSIMREESGYKPHVLSVSGARGLLQLMPATAERVAREEHLEGFSPDDLFQPDINIRLGSAYLSGLLREFDGRRSAAIGSYNAGPHVVARWVNETPGDDDVFVEEIPYTQTRGYVKRVMRSLHAYRVLY